MADSGEMILKSGGRSDLEFVVDVCNRLGLGADTIGAQERAGFGSEPSELHTLTLDPHSFTEEVFLISAHAENWVRTVSPSKPDRGWWTVKSVEETDRFESVYCFEVPT